MMTPAMIEALDRTGSCAADADDEDGADGALGTCGEAGDDIDISLATAARLLAADSRIFVWLDLYNYNLCIRG